MYHGEYHVHASETTAKPDVLSHLFCHAFDESYLAKNMSEYALARFDRALHAFTPEEFASPRGCLKTRLPATNTLSSFLVRLICLRPTGGTTGHGELKG